MASEGEEVEQSSNNSDHNADSDQKAAPVLSKQEKVLLVEISIVHQSRNRVFTEEKTGKRRS